MPKNLSQENTNDTGEATERKPRVNQVVTAPSGDSGVESDSSNAGVSLLSSHNRTVMMVAIVSFVALLVIAAFIWRSRNASSRNEQATANAKDEHGEKDEHQVRLSPELLAAANMELEGVTQRPAVSLLRVTGTVEANQQQTQVVTPLVGGRVERVNVALGDRVRAGAVIAVISSPQIAQMHGKLHESETALALAERNLERVQRSENRVAVLQAKARLDEAEATLKRTRRLIELGAGAGKDLIAAETMYRTAKADFDFQSNISLNRELQEAQAAVETSRVDVAHIRDEMRALGAPVAVGERDNHTKNTSLVALRAPVSGTVTERLVNAGAGVEAGQSLFTISNLSTVWVIANVPEASIRNVRVGTVAEVRSAVLAANSISGSVSYINPRLNEETRTAQVRVAVQNAGELLKAGMFVEVGFQTSLRSSAGEELMVPSDAVHRFGARTIVFVPKENERGVFEVRDVEVGGETDGYTRVQSGLKMGEQVVTKGSFTLKTQLEKSAMGDGH